MSNHHAEKFDGKRGGYVKVKATQGQGRVSMFAVDASNDMTFNPLTPDQARDIARSLQEAATLAESPLPKVGGAVVSAEQMEGLPEWTILRGYNGAPYHREGGKWVSEHYGRLSARGAAGVGRPFTILYLPEEGK